MTWSEPAELAIHQAQLGEPPRPILDPNFFYELRILAEKLTLLGLVYHNGKVIMTEETVDSF